MSGPESLTARKAWLSEARHRWLTACALFPPLRDAPLQLRLATLLWEKFNPHVGYAFPSRQWLADTLNVGMNAVSHSIGRLGQGDGNPARRGHRPGLDIIIVKSMKDLPEPVLAMLAKYRRTDMRGQVYGLNFGWAEGFLHEAGWEPPKHGQWIIEPTATEQNRCFG